MDRSKKLYWYNSQHIFIIVALSGLIVACGEKEENNPSPAPVEPVASAPTDPQPPRSQNPEAYAKETGESDTAAYAAGINHNTKLGIYIKDHEGINTGPIIESIDSGSKASGLDLQPNDIITNIGDIKISTAEDFSEKYNSIDNGIKFSIWIVRNDEKRQVEITK